MSFEPVNMFILKVYNKDIIKTWILFQVAIQKHEQRYCRVVLVF